MQNTATGDAPMAEATEVLEAPVTESEDTVTEDAPLEDEGEETLYFDRFETLEEAEKSYKEMQKRATRSEQVAKELRELQTKLAKKEEQERLAGMTDEEKLEYLTNNHLESRFEANEQAEVESTPYDPTTDAQEISEFVSSVPELAKYPTLAENFRSLAQSEGFREYTLDSIYREHIKPLINELGGKKVSTKKRPIASGKPTKAPARSLDVSKMSRQEWEENRVQLMREAGIQGI